MPGGYMGKTLRIDLNQEKIEEISFSDDVLRKYIGGRGLATKILFEEIPKGTDPLSPENVVVFMTGPYTGTTGPCSARFEVVTLSAHTKLLGAGNSGGFFGPELKRSGFDGVIISGKASDPVYLWIDDGKAELRSAEKIWGKDTYETEDFIKEELNDNKVKIATIGPAGENLVTYAAVMNDKGRTTARNGAAAVLGTKNFKAIACRGKQKIEVAFKDKFTAVSRDRIKRIKKDPIFQTFSLYGTSYGFMLQASLGDVPTKNWAKGEMDGMEKISGHSMYKTILTRNTACAGCIVACNREVRIDRGKYKLSPNAGPEYETLAAFGSMCLIDNIFAIAKANDICNRAGIDTISAGSTIAFAMECYEKGLITKEDLGGIELKWGNADAMLKCLDIIINKKYIGEILAQGTKKASKEIEGSEKFAIHVKGLEIAMHDPRFSQSFGLHYATTPCGGRHTSGSELIALSLIPLPVPDLNFGPGPNELDRFSPIGKAKVVKTVQDRTAMMDSMGMCVFLYMNPTMPPRLVSATLTLVTGFQMKYHEIFLKTGERISNLMQAFNIKHGAKVKDDTLPYRLLKEPLKEGGSKGKVVNLKPMLKEYYQLRGWDPQTGKPTVEKLKELDLDFVIKELYP